MSKKIVIIVISLLVLIGLTIGSFEIYKHVFKPTKVYVASHNLFQRNKIEEKDLNEIYVPQMFINDDICIDKDEIVDKYVKLSYSIPKGSYIYSNAIETDIKDLAYTLLKKDEVSYDIYTSEVKINPGSLDKNMCLDLYLTISDKDKIISDLLISNLRIIGFYDQNGKQINDYDNDARVHIVSVAINKDDVSIINKALVLGDIRVVINADTYYNNDKSKLNKDSALFKYFYEKND